MQVLGITLRIPEPRQTGKKYRLEVESRAGAVVVVVRFVRLVKAWLI